LGPAVRVLGGRLRLGLKVGGGSRLSGRGSGELDDLHAGARADGAVVEPRPDADAVLADEQDPRDD
jgi:hypothetical protein